MLWKANIDIQFIAEASLALAHYVSGYVTKAVSVISKERCCSRIPKYVFQFCAANYNVFTFRRLNIYFRQRDFHHPLLLL